MTGSAARVPISSAAEVWRKLVADGVILPNKYDMDIVTLLEAQLPGVGEIDERMEAAEWNARDLMRAMSPQLDSFARLMHDLLSLYSGIAATSATGPNLVISYEFDKDDVFDQSLENFRSAIATLERAKEARGSFVLSPRCWKFPMGQKPWLSNENREGFHALREGAEHDWNFTLPLIGSVDNPSLARGVSLVYAVLTAACDTMRNYGATMRAVRNNPALMKKVSDESQDHLSLYYHFTDYFPEQVIWSLQRDVEYFSSRPSGDVENWLREVEEWCSSFWMDGPGEVDEALKSILSLPSWGKRHELYSAWLVCVFAEAFKGSRLKFDVVDGRLSFPFRATRIASFEDRDGPIELWAEVRSAASGELSHGRKYHIQPDYRFLRKGQESRGDEMAIEVKQYLHASGARHGRTADDYARALPASNVMIVAYGQIGRTATNYVNEADRLRVGFRENIRSLESAEAKLFMAELAEFFPAATRLQSVRVVKSAVLEPEIRFLPNIQDAGGDTILRKGSSIEMLGLAIDGELFVEIVCHPEKGHRIDSADLRLSLEFTGGEVWHFGAAHPNPHRTWHVGTMRSGVFSKSESSVEISS